MRHFQYPSLLVLLLLYCAQTVHGQNEEDALRYSNILPGGSARSWALGGAVGAVGADPGSASTNPAGLALYNTSEFSLTPQFEVNGSQSTFYGQGSSDIDNRFSFNNLSVILSTPYEHGGNWRSGSYGISFDRQASYHWDQRFLAKDVQSTILQKFVDEANGTAPDQLPDLLGWTSNLAYWTYGIDPLDTVANTYSAAVPFGTPMDQDHRVNASGRLNTTSMFYAANYMDRFYVGATLGLVGVRYSRNTTHAETVADPTKDLNDLSYKEQLLTTGRGVNLKVGALGRVGQHLRLGLAFHSPQWLQLTDGFNYTMTTNFRTPGEGGRTQYSKDSPDGTYSYRIRTPWSVLASAVYVVGQQGLVTVDYAYTDYRQARLRPGLDLVDDYDFHAENDVIRDELRGTHSLRAGTEWRAGAWYFRGGWGIWPNAYKEGDTMHGTSYMRFTAGIGYRTEHLSLDLTGLYGTQDTKYFPYNPALVQAASLRTTDTRGMVTIAFRP
ncbi:MAG: hypothetical protein OZ932_02220 [Flavobacteriia bacterium]|nr:hypothetical protein [Flavobacteriia bacterium]